MTLDVIQLAYYAGFALLGWWLSKRGLLPSMPAAQSATTPATNPALAASLDQPTLVALLKAVLSNGPQPATTAPGGASNVIHVPIEVSASPKQPVGANPP